MLHKSILFPLIFLFLLIVGCSSADFVPENVDFPLAQSKSFSPGAQIRKIGVADSFIVLEIMDKLQAVDLNTNKVIWRIDDFQMDLDSDILFTDDSTVVMSQHDIVVIDFQGKTKFLNLSGERNQNIRLLSAVGNYVYVISGGNWDLEAYDIAANKMIWNVWTGRGNTQVFYEQASDIAYVANSNSVRAFDNASGKMLWRYTVDIDKSAYSNGILYISAKPFKSETYSITALDVDTQTVIWKSEFVAPLGMEIYGLGIYGDLLVLNSRNGLFAYDIKEGNLKWQSQDKDIFYTSPVVLDETLYAKGSSKKIYALSLESGNFKGYVRLEPEPFIGEPTNEAESGVYIYQDNIVVQTKNKIVVFSPKKKYP
jgi:outer membrane protein assembly factor BamB